MKIKLVDYYDIGLYNARDRKGFERGDMGKGRPKTSLLYSVYRVEGGLAHWNAWNAWGDKLEGIAKADTLEPYEKVDNALKKEFP